MESLLFTGGTGFLGANVMPKLQERYRITTCGISPNDMIKANLAKEEPNLPQRYDVVLHACGKAHTVPKTREEEQAFFDVNYQGTINLCRALERSGVPNALIFVSTVAVYGCEQGELVTEDHPLNGCTPYARSKIMAEEFLRGWCDEHYVKLAVIRPSLIAGKNPPGNLGSMIRGIKTGRYLNIDHGIARKSVLMAEDISILVPKLVAIGGTYNVCDDDQPSFGELASLISNQLNKKNPISIPYWLAKVMATTGDILGEKAPINSQKLSKIINPLTFSNAKAKSALDWTPISVLKNFVIE